MNMSVLGNFLMIDMKCLNSAKFLVRRVGKCFYLNRSVSSKSGKTEGSYREVSDEIQENPKARTSNQFDCMVKERQNEARRSILVQVHCEKSCAELRSYCSEFGSVHGMHYYKLLGDKHFILVEFTSRQEAVNVLKVCSHNMAHDIVPVQSPLVWFKAGPRKRKKVEPDVEMMMTNAFSPPEIRKLLIQADSVSDQMKALHENTKLQDLGTRLRFLTTYQVELALESLFPDIEVLPFGSSVNGFGKADCDLDMVLHFAGDQEANEGSRFVFHAKPSFANGRTQVQRHMEVIGDVLQLFLPGCSHVRRILQARVPIIKYRQELTGLDCDLSMTNKVAVYMSELLYLYSEIDPRVQPLVFTIRKWAKEVGLTNPSPGRWISNFSLTLMVMFFFQNRPVPILPPLNMLVKQAGWEDQRVTEGVDCTFLRDISCLAPTKNSESLETLLKEFFLFYARFDFDEKGISLISGKPMIKPEYHALYIQNPMERELNVSKNVSLEEMERLRIEFRNALWALEEGLLDYKESTKQTSWGLLNLFSSHKIMKGHGFSGRGRLVQVSGLFEGEEDEGTDDKSVQSGSRNIAQRASNKETRAMKQRRR